MRRTVTGVVPMTAGHVTTADGRRFFVLLLRIVAPTANCWPATGCGGLFTSPLAVNEIRETHLPFFLVIPVGMVFCSPPTFGHWSTAGASGGRAAVLVRTAVVVRSAVVVLVTVACCTVVDVAVATAVVVC